MNSGSPIALSHRHRRRPSAPRKTGSSRKSAIDFVKDWRINEVLGGAYQGKAARLASTLTHMTGHDSEGNLIVLCGSVKPDSMVNDGLSEYWPTELTCPKCAKRFARIRGRS